MSQPGADGSAGPAAAESAAAEPGAAQAGTAHAGTAQAGAAQAGAAQAGAAQAGAAQPGATESASVAPARGWGPQSAATTTLLLRHGQTALSVERRFAGRGDAQLTDVGEQQAAAAAARLAGRGGIDLIVTSPLSRARRTAEAVADATGAALTIDEDLAETDFGDWEGRTFAEVRQQWPEEMNAWMASADVAPPGGESLSAAARRALAALDRVLAEHSGKTIVVVSHVTPIKTIICRALLAPPAALFRIHLDVASLSEADWYADGPALLRSMNDTAHLRQEPRAAGRRRGSRSR
jgi:ribonuclease H / adenosylcobalamin/alpha-ribazole phosphatase